MKHRLFGHWAQPVTSLPWGIVTSVLFWLSKVSGYRVLNHAKACAWQRACGLA